MCSSPRLQLLVIGTREFQGKFLVRSFSTVALHQARHFARSSPIVSCKGYPKIWDPSERANLLTNNLLTSVEKVLSRMLRLRLCCWPPPQEAGSPSRSSGRSEPSLWKGFGFPLCFWDRLGLSFCLRRHQRLPHKLP